MDSHFEKWQIRHAEAEDLGRIPRVLADHKHLLPTKGLVLELACGRGAASLELARAGLEVHAWDYSPNAITRLQQAAEAEGLRIQAEVRDVVAQPPQAQSFDLVLVTYFMDRSLMPTILAAVKPQGLLMYETFCGEQFNGIGPSSPDWRFQPQELLKTCQGWQILHYHEEDRRGDLTQGARGLVRLVAAKVSVR